MIFIQPRKQINRAQRNYFLNKFFNYSNSIYKIPLFLHILFLNIVYLSLNIAFLLQSILALLRIIAYRFPNMRIVIKSLLVFLFVKYAFLIVVYFAILL